jgi:hypothetical protein
VRTALAWLAGALLALLALSVLTNCVSHVLGGTDTGALRDSLEVEARIYRDLSKLGDASDMLRRDRAYARGAYCSDLDMLGRSGAAPTYDSGAPIPCGVEK